MANLTLIRELCKERKISLRQLGKEIGINTPQGIQRIIKQNSTTIDRLEKIANILEVPIWMFFDVDPIKPLKQEIIHLNKKINILENQYKSLETGYEKQSEINNQYLQEIENLSTKHKMDQSLIESQANLIKANEKLIIEKERNITNLENLLKLEKKQNKRDE